MAQQSGAEEQKEALQAENEDMMRQLQQLKASIEEADAEIAELKSSGALARKTSPPVSAPLESGDAPSARGPEGSAPPGAAELAKFVAAKKLAVRSGVETATRKVGTVLPGEVVGCLEQKTAANGALRVRCDKGWVTATTATGDALLRPRGAGDAEPGGKPAPARAPLPLPNKNDLIELSKLKSPPSDVHMVLGALCTVLGSKGTAKVKDIKATLAKMKALDPTRLGGKIERRLAKVVKSPEFRIDRVAKSSKAAAGIAKWSAPRRSCVHWTEPPALPRLPPSVQPKAPCAGCWRCIRRQEASFQARQKALTASRTRSHDPPPRSTARRRPAPPAEAHPLPSSSRGSRQRRWLAKRRALGPPLRGRGRLRAPAPPSDPGMPLSYSHPTSGVASSLFSARR